MDANDPDDAPDMSTYVPGRELDTADMLKIARAGLGLSQSRTAQLLNVPQGTLQGWEQRRFSPDGASQVLIQLFYHYPHEIRSMLEKSQVA